MSTTKAHPIEAQLEVLAPNATEALVRGEVDIQIATAHRWPRSIELFQKRAISMVQMDEETAESCIYRRPVGKEPGGAMKYAEGLSVRMAEIVAACYGNIRYGAQIVSQTPEQVVARGFAHDLETNTASASECIESTLKRDKTPMDERMRVVIAKAALAKARRDALFQVVPKALCKSVEREARRIIAGEAKPLDQRREAVGTWVAKLSIEAARVWAALGVKGASELDSEKLITLTGIRTALKDGEITLDEAFPRIVAEGGVQTGAAPRSPLSAAKKPAKEAPADPKQDKLEKSRAALRQKLADKEIPEERLLEVLRGQGWVKESENIDTFTAEHFVSISDAWGDLVSEMIG